MIVNCDAGTARIVEKNESRRIAPGIVSIWTSIRKMTSLKELALCLLVVWLSAHLQRFQRMLDKWYPAEVVP